MWNYSELRNRREGEERVCRLFDKQDLESVGTNTDL